VLTAAEIEEWDMTQHTPGPWTYGPPKTNSRRVFMPNDTVEITCRGGPYGGLVAALYKTNFASPGMDEANARLIAAAPDMLEVLKRVEESLTALGAKGEPLKSIRAAIAKAERS
jgi:hypothetical protein